MLAFSEEKDSNDNLKSSEMDVVQVLVYRYLEICRIYEGEKEGEAARPYHLQRKGEERNRTRGVIYRRLLFLMVMMTSFLQ